MFSENENQGFDDRLILRKWKRKEVTSQEEERQPADQPPRQGDCWAYEFKFTDGKSARLSQLLPASASSGVQALIGSSSVLLERKSLQSLFLTVFAPRLLLPPCAPSTVNYTFSPTSHYRTFLLSSAAARLRACRGFV